MKFAKVGMRTIKTVIAVIFTIAISEILNLRSPLLASIAAIMTIEYSISESFETGKFRMYGTILGGTIALIITFIAPENFLLIGLGLILIINICNAFQWERAVRISMVVFLAIVLNYKDGDGVSYALNRTLDTLIGITIGTATNYFIRPPKIEEKIKDTMDIIFLGVERILEKLIWERQFDELNTLSEEINNIGKEYKLFKKDLRFNTEKEDDIQSYNKLFNAFENINIHLKVIHSIKKSPIIDKDNKEYIEKYFNREVPEQDENNMDDLDLIYNYHLKIIIDELDLVNTILYRTNI